MQLTPTQIPVDSRTKQLTAVVQALFPPPQRKTEKAVWPRETSYPTHEVTPIYLMRVCMCVCVSAPQAIRNNTRAMNPE